MDFYEMLGVPKTATTDQIKSAYRKLAMQYHPDRNPGDNDAVIKFKEVLQAYETLIDVNKRARYNGVTIQPNKRKRPEPAFRQKQRDFRIFDAPPPLFDLWGKRLNSDQQEEWMRNNITPGIAKQSKKASQATNGWIDSFANSYENNGQPDIR